MPLEERAYAHVCVCVRSAGVARGVFWGGGCLCGFEWFAGLLHLARRVITESWVNHACNHGLPCTVADVLLTLSSARAKGKQKQMRPVATRTFAKLASTPNCSHVGLCWATAVKKRWAVPALKWARATPWEEIYEWDNRGGRARECVLFFIFFFKIIFSTCCHQ